MRPFSLSPAILSVSLTLLLAPRQGMCHDMKLAAAMIGVVLLACSPELIAVQAAVQPGQPPKKQAADPLSRLAGDWTTIESYAGGGLAPILFT